MAILILSHLVAVYEALWIVKLLFEEGHKINMFVGI